MARSRSITIVVNDLNRLLGVVMSSVAANVTLRLREQPPGTPFGTPVDTGWASSNWLPSLDAPVTTPTGSKKAVSTAESDARVTALRSFRYRPDAVIYVTNSVPYITELNQGYSRQQPRGFVQRAITQAMTTDLIGELRRYA
jgi:hypothetical protein